MNASGCLGWNDLRPTYSSILASGVSPQCSVRRLTVCGLFQNFNFNSNTRPLYRDTVPLNYYLRLLFKTCTLSGSWPISEGLGPAGATYTAASRAQRRRTVLENAIISESRFLN